MSEFSYRERIYARYAEAGSADLGFDRPEGAPAGLRDLLDRAVRDYFPADKNAAILDLGCGPGLMVHAARSAGYENCEGVDISPQQVAEAERLGIDGVREGEVLKTLSGLGDGTLDAVLSFDLLEHMTRDELVTLIDAVHRVLKPGGRWIVHTCNAEAPFFGRVRFGDMTHEQAFTATSLNQVMIASDFKSVRCFEDRPDPRRLKGAVRSAMWHIARLPALFWLIAESGPAARRAILSQNLLAVIEK